MRCIRLFLSFPLIALAACAAQPTDVVEEFFLAIDAGDYERAAEYLAPETERMLGRDKLQQVMEKQRDTFQKCGGVSGVESVLEGDDTRQSGKIIINFKGDCEPRKGKVNLVKHEGDWKIAVRK